jgi:hypothetical protein
MTMDPIKQKILKLLNLANDKGATEDEAATAMRMAMGLMTRHGIEQSQLGSGLVPSRAKMGHLAQGEIQGPSVDPRRCCGNVVRLPRRVLRRCRRLRRLAVRRTSGQH